MGSLLKMPGANCSLYGCGTSRKHKTIGIFKLPLPKDDFHKQWRQDLLDIILRYRLLDDNLERQINENRIHICQRHFTDDQLYVYPSRKMLKEGALPTLNLLPPPTPISSRPGPKHSRRKLQKAEATSSLTEQSKASVINESPDTNDTSTESSENSLWRNEMDMEPEKTIECTKSCSAFRPYKPTKHLKQPRLYSNESLNTETFTNITISNVRKMTKSRKIKLRKNSNVCQLNASSKQCSIQTTNNTESIKTSRISILTQERMIEQECDQNKEETTMTMDENDITEHDQEKPLTFTRINDERNSMSEDLYSDMELDDSNRMSPVFLPLN